MLTYFKGLLFWWLWGMAFFLFWLPVTAVQTLIVGMLRVGSVDLAYWRILKSIPPIFWQEFNPLLFTVFMFSPGLACFYVEARKTDDKDKTRWKNLGFSVLIASSVVLLFILVSTSRG